MISFRALSDWNDQLVGRRKQAARPDDVANTKALAAMLQRFDQRLLEACRKVGDNPQSAPTALFVALPERLLAKCALMFMDRKGTPHADPPGAVTPAVIKSLASYASLETSFQALDVIPQDLKSVLLCHGLSPVGDSILLPADIGRGYRASVALGVSVSVMLADITWMSSNRSIRQFTSLSESAIESGLRISLDKRERLYEAIGVQARLHKITPFDRKGTISGRKLALISQRYMALTSQLWGLACEGKLSHETVRLVSRDLAKLSPTDGSLPEHIRTFAQFPGVLDSIERALAPHLGILRAIARQFNVFEADIFTYFFAQYYAQDEYRGQVVKVAPLTERNFDRPFDELDAYFRAWGDGHSAVGGQASAATDRTHRMSAVYLPQYTMGSMEQLPYSPLSLDALQSSGLNHEAVLARTITMDDWSEDALPKIVKILQETPISSRNRIVADVLSFLMCMENAGVTLPEVWTAGGRLGLRDVLSKMDASLPEAFAQDSEVARGAATDRGNVWEGWLSSSGAAYCPAHLHFFLSDADDWRDRQLELAARICQIAALATRAVVG